MPLLAESSVITWGCMAVLLGVCGFLLLRTQRYFARQAGSGFPVQAPQPQREASLQREPLAGSAASWEVEMHELARELSGRLDSKMGALEQLIRDADRAAARLEAALRATAVQARPSDEAPPSSQAEALLPGRAGPSAQAEPGRYDEIYLLADYGHPASEIAQRVGLPIGEIELILSLRKRR